VGLEKDAIKELLNKKTRALAVYRNFPNFYLSKHEIGPLISDIHKVEKKQEEIKKEV
jgi:hypothetical protein